MTADALLRHDWTLEEIQRVYDQPLLELIFTAASVHRAHFNPREIQLSRLVSVKTGGCPEDCHYCPQAARYRTGVQRQGLMELEEVVQLAKEAKAEGSSRLCLGAAWREVKDNAQFDRVLEMVRQVNAMGLEVCCTLGMLTETQAQRLKEAGLYAYNHNIDSSEEHYKKIISTRTYQDRLKTLSHVRHAGLTVCSGGILGMGETQEDRLGMIKTLSHLNPHPESVPINTLIRVQGTPLGDDTDDSLGKVSIWELVRLIATARIVMPRSFIRMSAGRLYRSTQDQALCFLAGANSIFTGEKLLTTPNNDQCDDRSMMSLLGLRPSPSHSVEVHA